jgi:hypothetical protein
MRQANASADHSMGAAKHGCCEALSMDSLRRGTARKPARTAGALNKSFRNWGRRFSVISGSCLIIWLIVTSTSVLPAHIFRRIRTVPRKTRASVHTRRNVDQIRVAMVCINDALFAEGAHSAERLRRSRDLVRSSPCCSYSRMIPVTALGSKYSNATDADKRHDLQGYVRTRRIVSQQEPLQLHGVCSGAMLLYSPVRVPSLAPVTVG